MRRLLVGLVAALLSAVVVTQPGVAAPDRPEAPPGHARDDNRRGGSSTTSGFAPRVLPDSLGVNAQFLSRVLANPTAEQMDASVAAIAANGLGVVRTLVHWRYAEPDPPTPVTGHTYNWAETDTYMAILAAHGVRAAPLFAGTPRWASPIGYADQFNNLGHDKWVPLFPEHFGAFMAAHAQRYGPDGTFWAEHPELPAVPTLTYEVWNEPNINGYFTNVAGGSCPLHQIGVDQAPKHYADLYAQAHAAVHAVQPDAVVMVGGISGHTVPGPDDRCTVQEFLAGMKAHRPDLAVDAIGIHVYRQTQEQVEAQLVEIRRVIDELGWAAPLPLYFNENGWVAPPSTSTWAVSDAQRGAWLAATADRVLRSNCGVRQYAPHTWLTPELDVNAIDHWFGIGNIDGSVKPSAVTYGDMARELQGQGSVAPNPAVEYLCPWRGEPDLDGDGVTDRLDPFPADPAA